MKNIKRTTWRHLAVGILLPIILSLLFYTLRGNREVMDGWVSYILKPFAQLLGRITSFIPFSVGECLILAAVVGVPVFLLRRAYHTALRGTIRPLADGCFWVLVGGLWVFTAINWMWNVTYYATSFTEKSGLDPSPYEVEELIETTEYFAQQAAFYSNQVPRMDGYHFIVDQKECFHWALDIYDNLEREFPFLTMRDVGAKPIIFSRTQSLLGFTGIYFPLTGEANVNMDAPWCLLPVTIAHELSHQRMVASEDEANFVGIAACVTSDNQVYQYSGYLLGLMNLSNALRTVAPERWESIWQQHVTQELYTDWQDNYNYWNQLSSPVEEVATDAYDNFLKGNDQELGMQSYGACVDLLVAYFQE